MARIRTFIAVDLADPIRAAAVALQKDLARVGFEVKWTEPENLHVTLVFLGEVADREVPAVHRILTQAVAGISPFQMTVEKVGSFPNPRRPRVLWVGVGQGTAELTRIHDQLELPLLDLGYRREDRRYTPHITLGRVKREKPSDPLAAALARRHDWFGGEMTVQEVTVMASKLNPDGPHYTVLGRARLG